MTLDVAVTDRSGKPVTGLQQKDFTLLDNKQPRNILSFRAVQSAAEADPPVQVILLTDEVNASFSNVSFERAQVEKFLRREGGKLPRTVTLAFLSDAGLKLTNVRGKDGNALAAELDRNPNVLRTVSRDQGFYGANDRVSISLNALEQLIARETPRAGRKLLIWLSPGWAFLTGPNVHLGDEDQQRIFSRIVKISDGLRRARISIYSVDPLGTADSGTAHTYYYEAFVKGVKKPVEAQIGSLALQAIAIQSGGLALNSDNDVTGEIARCIADADSYYVLTFDTLPGDHPNEYHALQIKLDDARLKTRTRTGYYAQPGR